MTAQQILLAMQERYAAMRSYQDRGTVLLRFSGVQEPVETKFSTLFERPDHFRFDWNIEHPHPAKRHIRLHNVIWSDGTGSFLYSDSRGEIEPQESLGMAIAGASGVSSGSAHTIPALLMPDVGGFTLPQLQRLTLKDGECDGAPCHLICGYHPWCGNYYEVYVGVHDLLLRRVHEPGRKVVSDELRTDIRIGELIDEQAFLYQPVTGRAMPETSYPDAFDASLVGTYPAIAKSGGGYVWDEVLEYRVWCHPERGAPDKDDGNDYYYSFAIYAEALEYSQSVAGAEEPLALILQREFISEPESGHYVHVRAERIAEWPVEFLNRPRRTPHTIPDFLSPNAPANRLDIIRGLAPNPRDSSAKQST